MKGAGAMCELVGNAGDTVNCAVKLGTDVMGSLLEPFRNDCF